MFLTTTPSYCPQTWDWLNYPVIQQACGWRNTDEFVPVHPHVFTMSCYVTSGSNLQNNWCRTDKRLSPLGNKILHPFIIVLKWAEPAFLGGQEASSEAHLRKDTLVSKSHIQNQLFHILEPENRILFKRYCLECYLALCQPSTEFGYKTHIKIVQLKQEKCLGFGRREGIRRWASLESLFLPGKHVRETTFESKEQTCIMINCHKCVVLEEIVKVWVPSAARWLFGEGCFVSPM